MRKMKNSKGFTLMEMLIVVAIIAVLIAIAIPTFTASLNKARVATDEANIRSGYASVMVEILTDDTGLDGTGKTYLLQKDGNVAEQGSANNNYQCKGHTGTEEKNKIEIAGTPGITWKENDTVSYTVKKNDDKVTVKIVIPATPAAGNTP